MLGHNPTLETLVMRHVFCTEKSINSVIPKIHITLYQSSMIFMHRAFRSKAAVEGMQRVQFKWAGRS
jgi:hypothetical protein